MTESPSVSQKPIATEKHRKPVVLPSGNPLCNLEVTNIHQDYTNFTASLLLSDKAQHVREGQAITPIVTVSAISSYGVFLRYHEFVQFVAFTPEKSQVVESVEEDEALVDKAFPEAEPVKLFDSSRIASNYIDDIKVVAANVFQVRRNLFDDFMKSRKEIKSIGFAVSSKGGFQATRVEDDGLFASLGLEAGDIIKSVNHQELRSIADVVGIYQQMEKYESVELSLERQGQKIYYYYNLFE